MDTVPASEILPLNLALAFLFGFGARHIGLPPLVGFLAAGFVLNGFGVVADDTIQLIADAGVTLLLFTIGLKLKLKTLARPEVCLGATVHAAISVAAFTMLLVVLSWIGLSAFAGLDPGAAALIAFALSFSSTVFAAKILEDKGELASLHGKTAIGILIMQDVFAVIFLTVSSGKLPSVWALALFALLAVRPLLIYLLDRVGHAELMPLFGLFAALTLGVALFEEVGLKPDLGALILGMLLAGHKRAAEVADSLFAFKEIFLVGFFLAIGLADTPSLEMFAIAVLLLALVPLKTGLFFLILSRFHLRARSALLGALSLGTYSEFGLIVAAIGVEAGWIGPEWLVVLAVALSLSFVLAAPFNRRAYTLYSQYRERLVPFETGARHPEDQLVEIGPAEVAVFGMGRVGTGAYDFLAEGYGDRLVGIETSTEKVAAHREAGRNVIHGDATDLDFWERVQVHRSRLKVVLLAMPEHRSNMTAIEQIRASGYTGGVAALAQYQDEEEALKAAGADIAFNTYAEAGSGFAAHVEAEMPRLTPPGNL